MTARGPARIDIRISLGTGEIEVTVAGEAVLVPGAMAPEHVPIPQPQALTNVQRCILEAAPVEPVSMKRLAVLAGYSYSQHFREAVHALIDRGFLLRRSTGVCKPPAQA